MLWRESVIPGDSQVRQTPGDTGWMQRLRGITALVGDG